MGNKIPLLDLGPSHRALETELKAAVGRVLDSQGFVLGEEGRALERELAEYMGVEHAIGCASGSDALLLALAALDVDAEQCVLTTPWTFFATAGSPARLGARIEFIDVERGTLNLDPEKLAEFLARCNRDLDGNLREPDHGKRVTTIISVDVYGRPCRYDRIEALAEEYGLHLIEDAAQAVGASLGGRNCGAFGKVATLSFYPTKNLGGAGDGGMLATNDGALAERLRNLRVHGMSSTRYVHSEVGINSRLDELQAAVLRVKLPHLDAWNAARQAHAAAYSEGLGAVDGVEPLDAPGADVQAIHHLYVIRGERRDALRAHLSEQGVGCAVYYPIPLHLQECFTYLGYRPGDLPTAEAASREVLALPMYPELSESDRDRVIDAIASFYR